MTAEARALPEGAKHRLAFRDTIVKTEPQIQAQSSSPALGIPHQTKHPGTVPVGFDPDSDAAVYTARSRRFQGLINVCCVAAGGD